MAILEKRKAVNQLPRFQRYQDTRAGDRAAALRGETPITSAIRQLAGSSGYGPMGESQGFNPMGGRGPEGVLGTGAAGFGGRPAAKNITSTVVPAGTETKGVTTAPSTSKAPGVTTGAKTTTTAAPTSKTPGLTTGAKTTTTAPKTLTSTNTGAAKTTTPAKTLTSTGTGAAKTTTTAPKTLTSTGTGAAKTTGTTAAKTTGSTGSTLGKTIANAVAGAALGVGTKAVINALTGGKKTTDTTGDKKTTGTTGDKKTTGTTGTTKITDAATKAVDSLTKGTGLTSVTKTTGSGTTGNTKTGTTGTTGATTGTTRTGGYPVKTGTTDTKTGTTGATTGTTGATTSPVTTKTGITSKPTSGTGPKIPNLSGPKSPTGPKTPAGTGTKTRGLTSTTKTADETGGTATNVSAQINPAYDDEGNLMPGYELDEDGNPVFMGDKETSTTFNPDGTIGEVAATGNTTETLDDGTTITYDRDGNVVGYTDTDGVAYDQNGDEVGGAEETDLSGDESEETLVGDAGTDAFELGDETVAEDMSGYLTDDDGNIYDADGNFIQYADGSTYEDTSATDVAYTDEYGGTYNANGDLLSEGDYSQFTQQDEYGNTYDFYGNLVSEADHSEFTQTDEFGNIYGWDGELISYAEGYDPESYGGDDSYAGGYDNTDYDDTSYASGDDEDVDVGKKGGLFGLAKGGSVDDPVHEKRNGDGTITQMFDDGSFVTYSGDGDVIRVSEGEKVQKFDVGGQAYAPVSTAANYQRNGYLTGASQGPLQAFLDRLPQEGDDGPQSEGDGDGFPISTSYYGGGVDDSEDEDGFPLSTTYYGGSNSSGGSSGGMGTSTTYNEDGTAYVVDNETGDVIDILDAEGNSVGGFDNTAVNGGGANNQDYMPPGAIDQGDGTFRLGNQVFSMENGNPLYAVNDDGDIVYIEPSTSSGYRDNGDGTYSIGDTTYSMEDDSPLYTTDSSGRIVPATITGSGGSGGVSTTKPTTATQRKTQAANTAAETAAENDFLSKLTGSLGGYGGSALAGAVLGGLLGNEELFGGNNTPSQSIDMSKVGVINPRTTDFGIGPSNFVGYDQYGTPERMPELYGRELYQNLNAPGFNEVNPGDYARMDAEEFGDQGNGNQPYPESYVDYAPPPNDGVYGNQPPEEDYYGGEQMAEGGMPSGGLGGMQTYYTFGKPTDPMQNLYNPQPAQQQAPQQPMQNQMAPKPQGMPQGQQPQMPQQNPMQTGPQGLKSGGLPAWSNVPVTAGRLNFRHGAPVHGPGDGQSDDIPAMLADGEYVIDAETVAQIGNGSTKAGAAALDKFRENIRAHKRSAPINKIPPKTKALTSYLRGAR